jgi:hypothetical protein
VKDQLLFVFFFAVRAEQEVVAVVAPFEVQGEDVVAVLQKAVVGLAVDLAGGIPHVPDAVFYEPHIRQTVDRLDRGVLDGRRLLPLRTRRPPPPEQGDQFLAGTGQFLVALVPLLLLLCRPLVEFILLFVELIGGLCRGFILVVPLRFMTLLLRAIVSSSALAVPRDTEDSCFSENSKFSQRFYLFSPTMAGERRGNMPRKRSQEEGPKTREFSERERLVAELRSTLRSTPFLPAKPFDALAFFESESIPIEAIRKIRDFFLAVKVTLQDVSRRGIAQEQENAAWRMLAASLGLLFQTAQSLRTTFTPAEAADRVFAELPRLIALVQAAMQPTESLTEERDDGERER